MSFVEHATRQVALAESSLASTASTTAERHQALKVIKERADAAQVVITELRQAATSRALNEIEAARLNIAILDQHDLAGMAATAATEAQSATQHQAEAQRKLHALRAALSQAAAAARRDALMVRARELECLLTDCLTAAWLAAKEAEPMTRFVHLWQPGAALRRAVAPNHMPPNGDLS